VVTIYVDDEPYEVEAGQNLLHACLSHQLELPYFCWHPSLGSVGACRQCAVIHYRDEDDKQGRLTMACMTPASEGTRISIAADEASKFRASVVEWLMENHPHDCPVCEEGGECHLQDMTVMTGHTVRTYRGQKRTFNNQQLGPFINHEMNRCITCFRCVRFYRDYAGGEDLQAFGSRDRMYFGRVNDGTLENAFSGNLVEVCPTGVFTDKPFAKTYTRKWDLQSAPSICPGCAVGCNVFPAERYGRLQRVHNRYHGAINGYFLCDRGRFGAHFVNSERRLQLPGKRVEDDLFEQLTPTDAVAAVTTLLTSGRVAGIGSPRASLETNTALQALVGSENFCNGLSSVEAQLSELALSIYRARAARLPSVTEVEAADAIVILGEDVLNTAPRIALALRQSVRNTELAMAKIAGIPQWQDAGVRGHAQGARNPLLIASIATTELDDIASHRLHGSPETIASAGFNIANALNPRYPASAVNADAEFVAAAARALGNAQQPLIVAGFGTQNAGVIEAATNVAWALRDNGADPALLLAPPEANTYGTAMLATGWHMQSLLEAAASGEIDTLIVAENDLFRRAPKTLVERALAGIKNLVVLDCLDTPTADRADIVLPAATFAESTGCFVNFETRVQRFYEVFPPAGDIAASWDWFGRIAREARRNDLDWQHVDDVLATCAEAPGMSAAIAVAPTADFRNTAGMRIPRAPHRYSGRTAMYADVNIHEPKTRVDDQTPLSYSMEGLNRNQPSELIPYVWAPGWNSNQSVFKFQEEVGGALLGGDPGVRLISDTDSGLSSHSPFSESTASASTSTATSVAAVDAGFRVLPLQHIFGSDELSMHSPAIKERARDPYVALHPDDATRLGVKAGDGVRCDEFEASFEVRIAAEIAPGNAGITLGFPGSACTAPEASVSLRADPTFERKRVPPELIAKG